MKLNEAILKALLTKTVRVSCIDVKSLNALKAKGFKVILVQTPIQQILERMS